MAAIMSPGFLAPEVPDLRLVPPRIRRRQPRSVYRRRRAVALLALVAAAILLTIAVRWLVPAPLAETSQRSGQVSLIGATTYVVEPGDTVWSIARRIQPTGDVRPLVQWLEQQRDGRALQPGEVIAIP